MTKFFSVVGILGSWLRGWHDPPCFFSDDHEIDQTHVMVFPHPGGFQLNQDVSGHPLRGFH